MYVCFLSTKAVVKLIFCFVYIAAQNVVVENSLHLGLSVLLLQQRSPQVMRARGPSQAGRNVSLKSLALI